MSGAFAFFNYNIYKILFIVFIIIAILLFVNYFNINLNPKTKLVRQKAFTMETFISGSGIDVSQFIPDEIILNPSKDHFDSGAQLINDIEMGDGENNKDNAPELPTMIPFSYNKLDIESPYEDGFCDLYEDNLFGLDNACQKLSRKNCLKTRCCGLLNKTQCLAGFETGPVFSIERYKSQLQNDPAMKKLNRLIYDHKDKS